MVHSFLGEPAVKQFEFWYMVFATTSVLISISLKTKWWRTTAGQNVFFLALWFVFTMVLLLLKVLGVFPDWLRGWDTVVVYILGGTILFIRAITVWVLNRGYWAWTKTESKVDANDG